MSILCKIGIHKWDGCRCIYCGIIRDEYHDWSIDCEKCVRCGKTRYNAHDWSRDCEKCLKCGLTRQHSHSWVGNKCSQCGSKRGDEYFIDEQFELLREGKGLSTEDRERCNEIFKSYYTDWKARYGDSASDIGHAEYYVTACKMGIIDMGNHGGWPYRYYNTGTALSGLKKILEEEDDLFKLACAVAAAIRQNEFEFAHASFKKLQNDRGLTNYVRWIAETAMTDTRGDWMPAYCRFYWEINNSEDLSAAGEDESSIPDARECSEKTIRFLEEYKQFMSQRTPMGEFQHRFQMEKLMKENFYEFINNAHLAVKLADIELRRTALWVLIHLNNSELSYLLKALVKMELVEALGFAALERDEESSDHAIWILSLLCCYDFTDHMILRIRSMIEKATQSQFQETRRLAGVILDKIAAAEYINGTIAVESLEGTTWEGSRQSKRGSPEQIRLRFIGDSIVKVSILGEYRDGPQEGEEFEIPLGGSISWKQEGEWVDIVFDWGTFTDRFHGKISSGSISGEEKNNSGNKTWYVKKKEKV